LSDSGNSPRCARVFKVNALLTSNLAFLVRRIRRAPLPAIVTLVTIAIGVGANTAVFSVVEGILLKPLPYPHPERLAAIALNAPGFHMKDMDEISPSMYFVLREQSRTFQDIGLYTEDSVNVTGMSQPEQVRALRVTDGLLPVLGVRPHLGRVFTRKDDSPDAPDTVVLSDAYWHRKFGGDPSIVGRSITINNKPRQVVGVLPKDFNFLDQPTPLIFLPFNFDRNKLFLGNFSYNAVARLKPGVTLAQADADVAHMIPIFNRSFQPPPGYSLELFENARLGPNIKTLRSEVVGDVGKLLWVLMGSIGLVLLIACANVANIFLVSVEGRQQELAIRAALGASQGRIARELLFESLILALAGGACGLALAYGGLQLLVALAPSGLPRVNEIGMDAPVLLFAFGISLLVSLLVGCIPIFKYAGVRLGTSLRQGGRTLSQSRERHRARNALVIVQVVLALVLLISSGLMIRTFRALIHVNPGFSNPASVQTFRVSISETEVADPQMVVRVDDAILAKIRAIPSVAATGVCSSVPMDGNHSSDPVVPEDRPYTREQIPPLRRFKFVSPGCVGALGAPLIAGRDLTWTDIEKKRPVVLVSENLAREYWRIPASALGKRIRVNTKDDWREIVGVVTDVYDDGVSQKPSSAVYWPILMRYFWGDQPFVARDVAFAIRTPRAGSEGFMKEVRSAVWSVDANLPLADVYTLDHFYRKSMARTSFTLVMLAIAGAMALLLGMVGIYGVISYSVTQRTREIGIRMALGAQQGELIAKFVRQGFLLALIGIAAGLVLAAGVTRLMSSLLFQVAAVDPITYAAMSVVLLGIAVLASYFPSRHAASVNPVEALRAE
jgi:predicted permease